MPPRKTGGEASRSAADRFARAVEWPIAILALAVVPALIMRGSTF